VLSRQGLWADRKLEYISIAVVVKYFYIIYRLFCVYFFTNFIMHFNCPLFQVTDSHENKFIIIIIIIFGQRNPVALVNLLQSKPHKPNARTLYILL